MKIRRMRKELLELRKMLDAQRVKPKRYMSAGALPDQGQLRSHACWILEQLEPLLTHDHEREANRLFGTAQALLFATGVLRVNQIASDLIDDEDEE